ncbi:MAG: T9SS type A sorting domain-containing protein [Saprospiraceae bacterium]|nr:T9SS type A sorting domain-containing protein [Saprospiraceae bacterium]
MYRTLQVLSFVSITILLLSNATGVPQAVTGAPGESGFSCNACHGGGNYNPTVALELFKDGTTVTSYNPSEIYDIRLSVSGMNDPRAYGFQLLSLKDENNADMGKWSELGERVRTRVMLNRVYLQQSLPKVDGIFTAKWQAPNQNEGNISFYFSGLAVNLNGAITGDAHAVSTLTIQPSTSSSVDNIVHQVEIFPNPTSSYLNILSTDIHSVKAVSLKGVVYDMPIREKEPLYIGNWENGIYFLQIFDKNSVLKGVTKLIKL